MQTAPSRVMNIFLFFTFFLVGNFASLSRAFRLPQQLVESAVQLRNHTAITELRLLNRRNLIDCHDANPYLQINSSSENSSLSDEEYVTVNVTGVLVPSDGDWVAMISPSHAKYAPSRFLLSRIYFIIMIIIYLILLFFDFSCSNA